MAATLRGAYHAFVKNQGKLGSAGYHFDRKTGKQPVITTRVTVIFNENTARARRQTFTAPLRKIGDLTLVKSFVC